MVMTLRDLEWVFQPTTMGELLARLCGPEALYKIAEKADCLSQPEGAALARIIGKREEFYRAEKTRLTNDRQTA
jgi:hypothetical protein